MKAAAHRPKNRHQKLSQPARPWVRPFAFSIGLFFIFVGWSLASPPSAIPDEPAHLIAGQGFWRGELSAEVVVPGIPTTDLYCFANQPTIPVSCTNFSWSDELTPHFTPAGDYPPAFYLLTGWAHFFGSGVMRGYLMRWAAALVNAIIIGFALARIGGFNKADGQRSVWAPEASASLLLCITPTAGMYLGGYNPSGLALALSIGMLSFIPQTKVIGYFSTRSLVGLSLFATLFIENRRDSLVWIVPLFVAIVLLCRKALARTIREAFPSLLLAAIPPTAAVIDLLRRPVGTVMEDTLNNRDLHENTVAYMWWVSNEVPKYFNEITTTLGWLDTSLPGLLNYIVVMFYGSLIFSPLLLKGRAGTISVAAFAYLIAVPITLVAILSFGYYQGRYALPLLPLLLSSIALTTTSSNQSHERPLRLAPENHVILLLLIHFLSVWQFIRRNSIGLGGRWNIFLGEPPWRPLITIYSPFIFLVVGSMALFVLNRSTYETKLGS